ncbi:MAG TPA: 4'-phosphopantetheinyl transferase superfamily protein [Chitinophagaceae bacterium]|jgi:4'-phosphopantetheinyl transferase
MIKLFLSNYRNKLNEAEFFKYLNLFPEEIINKILRLKRWEDRQATLYGKLLLKKGLEEAGLDPGLIDLKYTKYGRPYLEHAFDFNISHSAGYVVCVISTNSKIGIDIEEVKAIQIDDFKEHFSKEEWNTITGSDDKYFWFYYYWTAKEAVIKAEGKGLNLPLKDIIINNSKTKIEQTIWYIKRISFDNSYILQIASDKAINEEIDLSEISF